MKRFRFAGRCLLLILVLSLVIAVPTLADYEMWTDHYYEMPVAQAEPGKVIEDYFPFEGACTGLDFYVTGDGQSLMLYGEPLIPDDYYYDILYTYTDGTEGYVDFWVYVYPTEVSEPEPEPEPTAIPAPTPVPDVSITKHPTGETVEPGDSAVFIARADYNSEILWRVISPAGEVYEAQYADNELDGLGISGLGTETLTLTNIPLGMNGWSVECKFIGINGSGAISNRAKITVNEVVATAKPTNTPAPTPTAESQPTEEPASTEEPRPTDDPAPTREPDPAKAPVAAAENDKDGKGGSTAGGEEKSGDMDFRLVAAIALGVIGVGLVAVLVIMLVKKKPSAGAAEPAGTTSPYTFRCDKCGWKPADPNSIPRFCPNCGDVFDEKDVTVANRNRS